jgi:uncharacterized protein YjaG (DUF416 family)
LLILAVSGDSHVDSHLESDPTNMSHGFDRDATAAQLAALTPRGRVAFAAICAERLMPYYQWFQRVESWGNPSALRSALDAVWRHVDGDYMAPDVAAFHRAICGVATPDSEDFNSPLASRALDAAAATSEAVGLCIEPSPAVAAEVAEIAFEAAFGHEQLEAAQHSDLVHIADPDALKQLSAQGRLAAELELQQAVLKHLADTSQDIKSSELRRRFTTRR